MKIRISELRNIIREVIEESLEEKSHASNDRDDDGDEDFADVMMARMTAGGLGDEEAYRKSRKFDESASRNPMKKALILPPVSKRNQPIPKAPAMKRAGTFDPIEVINSVEDPAKKIELAAILGANLDSEKKRELVATLGVNLDPAKKRELAAILGVNLADLGLEK